MVPIRLPVGGGLDPVALSPQREAQRPLISQCRQWLACFSATLTTFVVGTVYGWTTTSLSYLLSGIGGAPLSLTKDESSWIISLTVLGSMIGSLVCALLAQCIGRKNTVILCNTMFCLGWMISGFAASVPILYFGRVVLGISIGIAHKIIPMYVSEVADINIKDVLDGVITRSIFIGSFLTCCLGIWMMYKSLLMVHIIISFICLSLNTYFPETPYYLVARGRKRHACKSIRYYRGIVDPQEMEIALHDIREEIRYELHAQNRHESHAQSARELHAQSASESHAQCASELQAQFASELHAQSASELQAQSASELRTQSARELHRSSTSEISRSSTSEIPRSSTSEIPRSSTSEILRSSTSEIPRSSTSEIPQSTTSEIPRSSTSEIPRSSTSEILRSSTSEIHQEVTSNIHPEATSAIHPEPTSEIHPEATSEIHPETTSEIHPETTSDLRTQSNVDSRGTTDTDEMYMDLPKYTWSSKLQAIQKQSNRKALFIMFGLIMAQHLSGNFITMQYLEVLLEEIRIGFEPNVAATWVLGFGLLTVNVCSIIQYYCGRRTLLMLSTLGSCITMIILAIYLLLVQHKYDVTIVSTTVPVIDLIVYQVIFQIGLGTIPNVLLCDLFPTELKGFVSAIIVIFDGIIGFIVPKLYQGITDNVGSFSVYFIFATSCILAFLMVLLWVPETKGKTYDEIEALLLGRNMNDSLNEEVNTYEMDIRRT